MTSIATTASIHGPVLAESGLLTPEVPALANARRRAAERRAAATATTPAAITLIASTGHSA